MKTQRILSEKTFAFGLWVLLIAGITLTMGTALTTENNKALAQQHKTKLKNS
jgi:hypothetical protein